MYACFCLSQSLSRFKVEPCCKRAITRVKLIGSSVCLIKSNYLNKEGVVFKMMKSTWWLSYNLPIMEMRIKVMHLRCVGQQWISDSIYLDGASLAHNWIHRLYILDGIDTGSGRPCCCRHTGRWRRTYRCVGSRLRPPKLRGRTRWACTGCPLLDSRKDNDIRPVPFHSRRIETAGSIEFSNKAFLLTTPS